MKRLMKPSLVFLALASCSKSPSLESVYWTNGNDIRQLRFLNEIETPVPKTFSVLNERIEFSEQVYSGARIENSFVKKVSSQGGEMHLVSSRFNGRYKKLARLNFSEYSESPEKRKQILAAFPELKQKDLESLEKIIDENENLFWNVLYFADDGTPYELRFDHNLKRVFNRAVGAHLFDAAAVVYPLGPKFSELKEVSLKDVSLKPALSHPLYWITSELSVPFNETDKNLRFSPGDSRFDQVQVYYYVERAQNWMRDNLGIQVPGRLDIQLHIGAPQKTNAAFYYQNKIRLGAGDDIVYSKIPQDASIVSHEVFHALVDHVARLPFEGEGGSLNEAYADFFTAIMLNRPHLGESAYLQGPYKRSVENNKTWGDKSGALYGDSLIISGTLWELSQAISTKKISEVALKTLSHLHPASQFVDFNRELHSALEEILTEGEMEKAESILRKRGFPL